MRMTDDEFVKTNPVHASETHATCIDDPGDQPKYVGMMVSCASDRDPRVTVQYSFKLDKEQARSLAILLDVASDLTDQ